MDDTFLKKTGAPFPLGALFVDGGINFSLYAKPADKVYLQLWEAGEIYKEFSLERTGLIWHVWIPLNKSVTYTFKVVYSDFATPPLLDPYSRKLEVPTQWDSFTHYTPKSVATPNPPIPTFNYPKIPKEQLIIYEMHVRGFTQHPSSNVKYPGTFLGVIEKIPHLKKLGINAVKLLPIFEFNECEVSTIDPITGKHLVNYWGYSPVHYFCAMRRYAVNDPIEEFRQMVHALHVAGIEVILDVVYNHTAEGNEHGPTYHFKGLSKDSYYILDENGRFHNFSGCGNSVSANHPVMYQLILESLRYWTWEMGVDGFRFDLTSLMTRAENGTPLEYPGIIQAIAQDPLLADVKIFAEAWDAAGLYQVGKFAKWNNAWTEWNGRYRDHVRQFIKGIPGLKGDFATRICGSQDLYHEGSPLNSLNFITAHDGFTLNDLVSYNKKHNLANGENDCDGNSFNDSWNCGTEGPTTKPSIEALRLSQMKNFIVALLTSAGVPMITSGDEYAQSKDGNNNTWCQDNTLNWIDWDAMNESSLPEFFQLMIELRKLHFQRSSFYNSNDIIWHGKHLNNPQWNEDDFCIAFEIPQQNIYCCYNTGPLPIHFEMPPGNWLLLVQTGPNQGSPHSCSILRKQ